MDKDVTDSRFGASGEVHMQAHIWQCNVAGVLVDLGSFGMTFLLDRRSKASGEAEVAAIQAHPQRVPIKRLHTRKNDLVKFGQGSHLATRKRRQKSLTRLTPKRGRNKIVKKALPFGPTSSEETFQPLKSKSVALSSKSTTPNPPLDLGRQTTFR